MTSQQSASRQSGSPMLNLPSELVEAVLIFAALQGHHIAASVVAQTCRSMRVLVYGAVDQHLWRELFLAAFDDPRIAFKVDRTDPSRQHRGRDEDGGEAVEDSSFTELQDMEKAFDWGAEFRLRVWARRHLQGRANLKTYSKLSAARTSETSTMLEDSKALGAVMQVIATALRSPPTVIISILPDDASEAVDGLPPGLSLNSRYPVFPPPPTAYTAMLRSGPTAPFSTYVPPPGSYASGPVVLGHTGSANIRWLEDLIAHGLPPDLIMKMSGTTLYGGLQAVWSTTEEAKQIRAFCKLLSCTGFSPIAGDETHEAGADQVRPRMQPTSGAAEASMDNAICRVDDTPDSAHPAPVTSSGDTVGLSFANMQASPVGEVTPSEDEGMQNVADLIDAEMLEAEPEKELPMSVQCQQNRARRMARTRVYNLRYLHPDRHWGPYLLPPESDCKANEPSSENFLQPILALFADHDAGHPHLHHDFDDEDVDMDDEDDDNDVAPGEEGDEDAEDNHHEFVFEMPPFAAPSGRPLPSPQDLYPDWAYLAAVRIVVEANLREAVSAKDMSGLVWLDSLRRDSAPKAVKREGELDEYTYAASLSCGGEGGEGWDWAGVTGSWRRCVCWMDYRDLIMQNVEKPENAFSGVALQEAVRIIPMRLRVVSFSPCPVPGYAHRPTLHIAGESAGPVGSGAIRKMKGTVGVIADGSIRWNLYSLIDEDENAEWVTEGIQLGEARSAMGILGMWTGAQHDRMDPIGPFWMWKVG